MPKKSRADVLYERDPPKVAWSRVLRKYPEGRNSVWSLDRGIRPTDVIQPGRWRFMRGLGGWGDKPFVEVYRSVYYTDPTYLDAWIEFRIAQVKVRDYLKDDFNSIFFEDVCTAAQYSPKRQYGPTGKWLHFGTGS